MRRLTPDDRKAIGAFLTDHRGRLRPTDFGFTAERRRTPGLRREEVASLSGVSVSWYTWLEQARDIQVSSEALLRVAKALRLNEAETTHLFALGHRPVLSATSYPEPSAALIDVVRAIDPVAAYIRNRRMDILAWNDAITELFVDYAALQPAERNTLKLIFLHPLYRSLLRDWEDYARGMLRVFRAARAKVSDKAPFDRLVEELAAESLEFRAWWPETDVQAFDEGIKRLRHPSMGLVDLSYVVLTPDRWSDLSVVTYLVKPGSREERS